jgi:nicotinate-nucleotide adenylyltransferase
MARDPSRPTGEGSHLRIGIFGGTFDPPHVGHLIVAQDVAEALDLDRVVWVPAATPPHKEGGELTAAEDRLALVEAAVADNERFQVTDLEVRRAGVSYTVDTLRELRGRWEGAQLHLIIGADQYRVLDTWREPAEIARLARVTVMSRNGSEGPPGPQAHEATIVVPVTRIDISSTDVRERLRSGRSVAYLVPAAVRRIIEHKGLYASLS